MTVVLPVVSIRCARAAARLPFVVNGPLALVLIAASAAATAQAPEPLSLAEALQLAEQRSSRIVAEEAAALAAREMAVAAGQPPDPLLTASITNLPIDGPDRFSLTRDFMTMSSVGLMRELTREEKRAARSDRFEREAEVAEARRLLARSALQRRTAASWLERHYHERMLSVLREQHAHAAMQVEAVDLAYRSGLGAQSDVFAARAAVATIEDRLAAAERDVAVAAAELRRWIGAAVERPLATAPPLDAVPLRHADLEAEVLNHPQLAVMAREEAVALAEAEIARAEQRPDWTIGLMYSLRGSAFSDMVSVNVSRPLQLRRSDRQDRELAARLAMVRRMRAEREEEARAHAAELDGLLRSWQSNRGRLERYVSDILPLATGRTLAAAAAYRVGDGSLEAVLDARVDEVAARLDHLRLELETAELWAELRFWVPVEHSAERSAGERR